jgi:RNA polymerase sigma-70 factor (ECF subfamily)
VDNYSFVPAIHQLAELSFWQNEIKFFIFCINYMEETASRLKDEEIVQFVQSGKVGLFGILIDRYENKIGRYARKFIFDKEDISDVLQDIFIKAYTNIQSFDTKRKFSSWLYRIAHNELVNALKKRKKQTFPFFNLDTFFPYDFFDHDNINQKIDNQEAEKIIDQCLSQLEPKYREPIVLYYLEELTYEEIADIMQIPVSTVGVRINRAKKIIKSILKKIGYNHEQ